MIQRLAHIHALERAINRTPVTSLLGPRQCGKTTLARILEKKFDATFFDLESSQDLQRLQNPELILGSMEGLVIIDEIQEKPELFKTLRVLADKPERRAGFLILGSASPHIIKKVSESLAGRTEFVELSGFNFMETDKNSIQDLWIRGGYPLSYLADTTEESISWRDSFIRTFLERDIPQLGFKIPSVAMRRFWTMLAHYHGQTLNASEIGRSLGVTDKTIRTYLDILTGTFMMRQLQPWYENLSKRQVKAPKIYFRDSGLLHHLLTVSDMHSLLGHPKLGASWEGFAMEQAIQILNPGEVYYWATYTGAELDLMFLKKGKKYGIEFKFNEAPKLTKSMCVACEDLKLAHLWIVYPGEHSYPVEENISVLPLKYITDVTW
jgi:predicted AAA+ superfamily ATPase